jgi:UDP-N-acetylglucosamine 2-epimerase
MKIVSVVGARPNFIKLAPLSREIRNYPEIQEIVLHTGQHYDYLMNRIFFDELRIPPPDYHLGVGSGPHGAQTGAMLQGIEDILLKEQPDQVLVFGDTNTTLAGALAGAKLHFPVAHVEAGLRSFDRQMPEEVNRVLTDHCSDLLFCPTKTAVDYLAREGIIDGVHLTGDVMVDILEECVEIAEQSSSVLERLSLRSGEYLLVTLHRAENTDSPERLAGIAQALRRVGASVPLVFPCHPRTQIRLTQGGLWNSLQEHAIVIPPVGYLEMLVLEKNAKRILTDSGGVQKEAFLLNVPCVTLRETTEWVETITSGRNILVGSDPEAIIEHALTFESIGDNSTPFPFGHHASARIASILSTVF